MTVLSQARGDGGFGVGGYDTPPESMIVGKFSSSLGKLKFP